MVSKVKAKLKLDTSEKNIPRLTQVGAMLVTHWGLSGVVILKLSALGARHLSSSDYQGSLQVDFMPDLCIEDVKSILSRHKNHYLSEKHVSNHADKLKAKEETCRVFKRRNISCPLLKVLELEGEVNGARAD